MKLADAARTNDEAVEAGTALTQVISELGHDVEEVAHVAEQRALRAVVYQYQGQKGLDQLRQHGVAALGHSEQSAALLYSAMYLDGIAIGLRASDGAEPARRCRELAEILMTYVGDEGGETWAAELRSIADQLEGRP